MKTTKVTLSPKWKNDLATGDLVRWCAYLEKARKTCTIAYRSLCKNKYRLVRDNFDPKVGRAFISVHIEDEYEDSFIKKTCPLGMCTILFEHEETKWNNFIKNYT